MMDNFWFQLPRPHFALAPMEDVTDTVFRELIAGISSPDKLHVVFSEFMSVDGFLHRKGHERVKHRLAVSPGERKLLNKKGIKIVAQIWGSDPEKFYRAGRKIATDYEFDGIDINMGCPVKKIVKHNSCSALINFPVLAREIIAATREGSGLPVSVKTRIGFKEVVTEEWISNLLQEKPEAITIHGRTQMMQSEGSSDWNEVNKAVQVRNEVNPETMILGNGDIISFEDALKKVAEFKTDGIMIGRGIFHNPAFFAGNPLFSHEERMALLKKHLHLFEKQWGREKNYAILKRFFKIYVHSFNGAGEIRASLMETNNFQESMSVLERLGDAETRHALPLL
ncbi:MAG: tRNA-dihydrouridine synthase [Bacteroidales bacterium]